MHSGLFALKIMTFSIFSFLLIIVSEKSNFGYESKKNEKRYSNEDVLGFDISILLSFELNDREDLNEFCS